MYIQCFSYALCYCTVTDVSAMLLSTYMICFWKLKNVSKNETNQGRRLYMLTTVPTYLKSLKLHVYEQASTASTFGSRNPTACNPCFLYVGLVWRQSVLTLLLLSIVLRNNLVIYFHVSHCYARISVIFSPLLQMFHHGPSSILLISVYKNFDYDLQCDCWLSDTIKKTIFLSCLDINRADSTALTIINDIDDN